MFGRRRETEAAVERRRPLVQPPRRNGFDGAAAEVSAPEAPGTEPLVEIERAPTPPADGSDGHVQAAAEVIRPVLAEQFAEADLQQLSRAQLMQQVETTAGEVMRAAGLRLGPLEQRGLVAELVNELAAPEPPLNGDEIELPVPPAETSSAEDAANRPASTAPASAPAEPRRGRQAGNAAASRTSVEAAKRTVQPKLMQRIDMSAASQLPRDALARELSDLVVELLAEDKIQLNLAEQRELVTELLNDMLGLGPLEPLLADESITDIMVNGPKKIYVERRGKLDLTDVQFRDNAHVLNIATRIVTRIGRRVDESSPICDARLADGSRVNIIIPPLAIDGPSVSIRKFSQKRITLDVMERQRNLSPQMAQVLRIAGRTRCSILISGGTGSGKTTLLNALSQMIEVGERVVTIEDAAELQLQQPHVVRLETRPPNLEGQGEVTMRDLVKNALRMRPDRIILGEVRGAEAIDMLQAMNTGHEGSMGTIHANRPREALTRLENMVGMGGLNLPAKAIRTQIASAIDLIVQISRMRDGMRRITRISEVVGMEGDIMTTQDLFWFEFEGEDEHGKLKGSFKCTGLRPHFTARAEYFGLDRTLLEQMA
jgi:pilus assembly protein CpaF